LIQTASATHQLPTAAAALRHDVADSRTQGYEVAPHAS
jgi:hypothetical protein